MPGSHSISGVFSAMESTAITVHQERCAKVRNRNVVCLKCADACTSGCISLQDSELVIDASQCVGCGTCATVCPTCALEARNPDDAALLDHCTAKGVHDEVYLACEPLRQAAAGYIDEDRAAFVVCLGRVEEALLAELANCGAKRIHLLSAHCASCAQVHGFETARMVADTANELFAAWGSDVRVQVEEGLPAELLLDGASADEVEAALSAAYERGLANTPILSTAGSEASLVPGTAVSGESPVPFAAAGLLASDDFSASAPKFLLPHVMRDGTLPHFVPDRRERLLDALSGLGEPVAKKLSVRLWGCVVINGMKCSSCCMCATFCPTGAIRKFENPDGSFGVEHYPGDCVKCRSCEDICRDDAIMILDEVPLSYVLGGEVHRYNMTPRPVELNDPHQILNTMRQRMGSSAPNLYER